MDWTDAAAGYYRRTWDDPAGLAALSADWQRELVALMLVNREVWNGGYLQFFVNHGPEVSVLAGRAFRAIGAPRMAAIVDRCQALLDEHVPSAATFEDRRKLIPNPVIGRDGRVLKKKGSVLPSSVLARLSELSDELIGYPDDVGTLAEAHYRGRIAGDAPPAA